MAETKRNVNTDRFSAYELLQKIYVEASFHKEPAANKHSLFVSKGLEKAEAFFSGIISEREEIGSYEWQQLELSKQIDDSGKIIKLVALPQDIGRFKKNLLALEQNYLTHSVLKANEVLGDMVLHGQELLRRKYLAKLLDPDKQVAAVENYEKIIETGAAAIQIFGRAPRPPQRSFRKFNSKQKPEAKFTGIEILSSGAFPDWFDKVNLGLRETGKVKSTGFENVIQAALDSPRSRAIARAVKLSFRNPASAGKNKIEFSKSRPGGISPYSFPVYFRTMLDLELMRLGQATTPGTFRMLLNSYYYGARIFDHSTNVSEQVQIIYEEENWNAPWVIEKVQSPQKQAREAAAKLVLEYFRYKPQSPVARDHYRTARIEFADDVDPKRIKEFFSELFEILDRGKKINGAVLKRNRKLNKIIPVLRFTNHSERARTLKKYIDCVKSCGFKELYVTADYIRHVPGLLQYFSDAQETNAIITYSKSKGVRLLDGRTVDMVATSNKAIEAAAGAIMSGQGCIKVGLLGLTYEQMFDFIKMVKDGLDAKSKRQGNQLLVFIGLIDEPVVSNDKVFTNPVEIADKFVELMRRRRHDILLLDTMHKGKTDKRFVNEKDINPDDTKGGHLTFNELKKLIKKAHDGRCDIWVAGSYTEDQVYQASLEPPQYRPGLICLGGAERSFGGIRLDPRDAYEAETKNDEEQSLAALVQMDADISYNLSRENKLSRDAGHVEGELRRRGKREAGRLLKMRKDYKSIRKEYFELLSKTAAENKILRKNLDLLIENEGGVFSKLKNIKKKYFSFREKYVETITGHMYDLFAKEWFN